jgi:hypothetical protein
MFDVKNVKKMRRKVSLSKTPFWLRKLVCGAELEN